MELMELMVRCCDGVDNINGVAADVDGAMV